MHYETEEAAKEAIAKVNGMMIAGGMFWETGEPKGEDVQIEGTCCDEMI